MSTNSSPFNQLETIAEILPAPVYWVDRNNVILGVNPAALKAINASGVDDVIGKTLYNLYPKELADPIVQHNNAVMEQGISLSQEEKIQDLQTGKTRYYTASKAPLRDESGKVIGLVGTSIEVTAEKEAKALRLEETKKANVLKYLELLAPLFPVPVYWNDLDSAVLGGNEQILAATGIKSIETVLGKTLYEFYPYEIADHIVKHNKETIRTGQIMSQEEPIKDISTGRIRYYDAFKAPLRDEDGKIIGTLGTSIEITDKKENERLLLENKNQKIEHQQKLITLAHSVAHDISSPLSALNMMMYMCDELPESKRSVIKKAIVNILDIANNLLATYRNEEQETALEIEQRQPVLISDLIIQLLSEKKAQYSNHPVRFDIDIVNNAQFVFSQVQASQLRRALSNLINNAVDALDSKVDGSVTVKLLAEANSITVEIQDNGKGMSSANLAKMQQRQSFTEGKENGHGLGLQQVWNMLEFNQGTLQAHSTLGEGSSIRLTFPRTTAANWLAHDIHLVPNNILIILDDDESVHGAWDLRFASFLKIHPTLRLLHFTQGQGVVDFLETLSQEEKDRVIFLSDYELLRQNKNGLQIIEESQLRQAILVTSYYANPKIQETAARLGVKILPKQLASVIPIYQDKL